MNCCLLAPTGDKRKTLYPQIWKHSSQPFPCLNYLIYPLKDKIHLPNWHKPFDVLLYFTFPESCLCASIVFASSLKLPIGKLFLFKDSSQVPPPSWSLCTFTSCLHALLSALSEIPCLFVPLLKHFLCFVLIPEDFVNP